jgi:hypothetical protein
LAVGAYGQSVLNILMGNGDGTFVAGPTFPTGQQPTSVRAADFNRDGRPDLVLTIGGHPIDPITLQNYVTIFVNTPLVLSKTSMTFQTRTVGTTSNPLSLGVRNIGFVPLSVSSIAITGANPGDFSKTTNCPSSLAAGAACQVNVTFTPSATGLRTANLSLTDGAPASPQNVLLQGKGQ